MNKSKIVCALFLVALATGCTRDINSQPGDAPNLQSWVDQVNSRKAEPLEPLPTLTRFEAVPYNASTDRDPFSPQMMMDRSSTTSLRPDESRPRQPLEAFALDSLKMVGTMGEGGALSALMMGPDNITYRVRAGEYLGQNDGRIVVVFKDRVELVEVVSDGAGGWMEREAAVSMAE